MSALKRVNWKIFLRGLERLSVQWSWIAEGLSQISMDAVFWRKVYFLEQLWGNGKTPSCADLPKCIVRILVVWEVVLLVAIVAIVHEVGFPVSHCVDILQRVLIY